MKMSPMHELIQGLRQDRLVRFIESFSDRFPTSHLKDVVVDEIDSDRTILIQGRRVINFGSDSFLGLDQDSRVRNALVHGVQRWGTHNGASRAFSSVRANADAEHKLANWLGTEAVLIYPSVTLANMGAIPGLLNRPDLLILDEHAHNSIQEAARIAQANGVRVLRFTHCDPHALDEVLERAGAYRSAMIAIDGVYSMTGALPPLMELNKVALRHGAVMYVDDAHATGILGKAGRGTVFDALGSYQNCLVVGSLSKAFSCAGGFIGCTAEMKRLLKIRSNTYIFGGPVPPPYLEAICTVCDILSSTEFAAIRMRLHRNIEIFWRGAERLGLTLLGGATPILSVFVGDEDTTLIAGHFLFQRGYYVQSVVFPAVPFHAGLLRVQINANHRPDSIEGLVEAFAELARISSLPVRPIAA